MKPEKGEAGAVMPPFLRKFLYSCYVPLNQQTPRSSPFISPLNASADAFPQSVTIITCEGDSLAREGQQLAAKIQKERASSASAVKEEDEKVLEEDVQNGVLCWDAKGQGHAWDKQCKVGSGAAKKRDYAYALSIERLKRAFE
jgi:acetyl esterase/lipase